MIEEYEYFLFDADETLFDFSKAERLALADLCAHLGINKEYDEKLLLDTYKKVNLSLWNKVEHHEMSINQLKNVRFSYFLKALDIEYEAQEDLNELYLDFLVQHSHLVEGSTEVLSHLKYKKKSIITNGFTKVQRARLSKTGISHHFDHIVISEEINCAKPSCQYFEHIHRLYNFHDKSKFLVVGDGITTDILGGNAYGFDTCWINLSKKEKDLSIKPTYEITNVLDLLNI